MALLILATLVAASPIQAQTRTAPTANETEKSAAALQAIQQHWSDAEAQGDTAYLDALLLPEYRSVNVDGTAHSKAALIASALRQRGSDGGAKAMAALAAWRLHHPHGTNVVITDNTAIMSYYLPDLGPERGRTSADVLVYRGGRWRVIYSAHTAAGAPAAAASAPAKKPGVTGS